MSAGAKVEVVKQAITVGAVDTVAQLRLESAADGAVVEVLGFHTALDGGGGLFMFQAGSTESPPAPFGFAVEGMVVVPASGSGRWRRISGGGGVSVRHFGAAAEFDSYTPPPGHASVSRNEYTRGAIQAAIDYVAQGAAGACFCR